MDIQELMQLDDEALFERAGRELSLGSMSLGESDDESLRARGHRWFRDNRKDLAEKLCNTFVARHVLSSGKAWDQVLLIAALADILSAANWGVAPATAAALVARVGLNSFCENCQS